MAFKNLWINPVWQTEIHHHPMSWYQFQRTQTLIIPLIVPNCNWGNLPWNTSSHFPPSILKSLGSSMNNGSPLGIYAWLKAFMKSIIWLYKPRIHCKININLTVAHWTTGEYEFWGLGDNRFWISPLTQYRALNFLIVQSGFLLHLKDHVPGSTLWSAI